MQAIFSLFALVLFIITFLMYILIFSKFIVSKETTLAFAFPIFFLAICSLGYIFASSLYQLILILLTIFVLRDLIMNKREVLPKLYNFSIISTLVVSVSVAAIVIVNGGLVFFVEGVGDITIFSPTPYALETPLFSSIETFQKRYLNDFHSFDSELFSPNDRLIELGWTVTRPGWFALIYFLKQFGLSIEWSWYVANLLLITVMMNALIECIKVFIRSMEPKRLSNASVRLLSLLPCVFYGPYIAFYNGSFAQLQGQAVCACYLAALLTTRLNLSVTWHLIFILAGVISYYPSSYVLVCLLISSVLLKKKIVK